MGNKPSQDAAKAYQVKQWARQSEKDAMMRQQNIASGQSPSISQMQFNKNIDQANQQAMAVAASQRGVSNPALAFRQALMANQQNTMDATQQGAIMAEQERRAADEYIQRGVGAMRGVSAQSAMQNQQAGMQQDAANKQMVAGMAGAAGAAIASDEKLKESVSPATMAPEELAKFVKALSAKKFDYKEGSKNQTGILAQDMEKSDIGKQMVIDTPQGKMIDTNKAVGALLAATAQMKDEIDSMKKKKA